MTDPTGQKDGPLLVRPTGSLLINCAAVLCAIAALFLVAGALKNDQAFWFWMWIGIFAAGQIAVFLAIAGFIIRALWFLPGDDEKWLP